MTISTTNSRVEYTGAGTTGPFSFPYYFLEDDDLVVIKRTIATGAEQTLVLTTDYTVSGAGVPAGGSVTTVAAVASSYELVIFRDPDLLQGTEYPDGDRFPAASHERALDKLTMVAQRIKNLVERCFRLSDGDTSGASMILPIDRANKYVAFDANGDLVATSGTSSDIIVSAYAETLLDDANAAAARATLGLTANGQSLVTAADFAAMRALLDLEVGTDFNAYAASASQAEAEAGAETALRVWSPLRVAQAAAVFAVDPASQAEQEAAASNVVFVSPANQHWHPSAPKAWARFDGTLAGTNAPSKGFNVTSVQRTGTGAYTVNLGVTMSDALYAVVVSAPAVSNAGNSYYNNIAMVSQTTTSFTLAYAVGALADPATVCFAVHGDLP